jgi:ankyrin repeat protein
MALFPPPDSDKLKERTWLCRAAKNGHDMIVSLLLKNDKAIIDPETMAAMIISNADVAAAAVLAAQNGHKAVVEIFLRERRLVANWKDTNGRTLLSHAVQNKHKHGEHLVDFLLTQDKIDIDSRDDDGRTPLSYAAGHGSEHSVRILLKNGAVQDTTDKSGQTPLSRAIEGQRIWRKFHPEVERTPIFFKKDDPYKSILGLLGSPVDSSPEPSIR